jgi:hypothetical protein
VDVHAAQPVLGAVLHEAAAATSGLARMNMILINLRARKGMTQELRTGSIRLV